MRALAYLSALALVVAALPAHAGETDAQREADLFGAPQGDAKSSPSSAPKKSNDHAAAEDEMFGGPAPVQTTPAPSSASASAPAASSTPSGLAPIDENALIAEAIKTNNKLQIGGRFFNQDQISWHEKASLQNSQLSLPSLLDVYLDGRPSDRVRIFALGRVQYDPTVGSAPALPGFGSSQPLSVALDQLWLKWDIYRKVFFTLGRQRIKWGSGVFWNPTDFLNPQKLNALALVDTRLGTDMLKIEVPVEKLGWNFYAIADLPNASTPDHVGTAFRGEFTFGTAELALSAAFRKAAPPQQLTLPSYLAAQIPDGLAPTIEQELARATPTAHSGVTTQTQLGADISAGVGPFDVHAEVAVSHGLKSLVFDKPFAVDPTTFTFQPPSAHYVDAEWVPQAVVGADVSLRYGDQGIIDVAGEYFYNGLGYSDPNLYPTLIAEGAFTPFYLGEHYAALSVSVPNPGTWDNTSFTLSQLANLSDWSFLTRLDYSVVVLTNLTFRAFANYHWGRYGELKFALAGATAGLPTGTATAQLSTADIWDVGVGFIEAF